MGTLWLSLRVIWAIQSVNLGYDADIGPQPGGGGGPPSGSDNGTQPGGDEDGGGGIQQMDRSELMYMVTLSCMIYVCVWSVCFLRAATFYNLLRASHGAPTATA